MELFQSSVVNAPLAVRLRPRTLAEFYGHQDLLGPGQPLRLALEKDRIPSLILWGPPGCGKTTLARILARQTRAHFQPLSAVTAGVAEVRKTVEEARQRRRTFGQSTILFLDEIHRFNRAQQDALLPHVEEGLLTLIGATTENPHFTLTAPLLSRCQVVRLEPLRDADISAILTRALEDKERGLGEEGLTLSPEARTALLSLAAGDARVALNTLEQAAAVLRQEGRVEHTISRELVLRVAQKNLPYDRAADQHYDSISAYIKSLRGSDPDAALYWLARLLSAGEDPLYIARRLVIAAAEDVGNADPQALQVAVAAAQAVQLVGLPEGRIPLAQATVYVATAPKSNASYLALQAALEDVHNLPAEPVPLHLRNSAFRGAEAYGFGEGYHYPHDFPGHFVKQEYRPPQAAGRSYYQPSDNGYEREIKERLHEWWGK
ncbi:MAG TPA: replication-associated recombination protein A [Firmicutes bacterium]|nr:replication-associated recombination protein A [Bacillota bacterium]